MNVYQPSSTPFQNGEGKMYLLPHKERFLVIWSDSNGVFKTDLIPQSELSGVKNECHYFDLSLNFNLLPKLSDEMIDETALVDFMNWTANQAVYKHLNTEKNIEIQFQTDPIADLAVSHGIPSVIKHHVIELMLSICQQEGVFAMSYLDRLFITVYKEDKVLLCNSFQVKTDEEVLYYLLLVYQELDLSQEETSLFFYGQFPEKGTHTRQYLSTYIRNLDIRCFEKVENNYQGIVQLLSEHYENN